MTDEQRHTHRQPLFFFLEILNCESGVVVGYLGDVSPDGLMFISETHYPVHEEMDICILLPEEHSDVPRVSARIETRWSEPNLNPKLTCIGCRFVQIEEADLQRLVSLTKALSFNENVEVKRVMR